VTWRTMVDAVGTTHVRHVARVWRPYPQSRARYVHVYVRRACVYECGTARQCVYDVLYHLACKLHVRGCALCGAVCNRREGDAVTTSRLRLYLRPIVVPCVVVADSLAGAVWCKRASALSALAVGVVRVECRLSTTIGRGCTLGWLFATFLSLILSVNASQEKWSLMGL
jgi:hypothetical protein